MNKTGRVVLCFSAPYTACILKHFLCTFNLAAAYFLLIFFVFRRIGDNYCLVHISRNKGNLFIIYRIEYSLIGFIQCSQIDHFIGARNAELCRFHRNVTFFFFHLFQWIGDHVRTVSKTVKETIVFASQTGIGTKDKVAAFKVADHFCFQRFESDLFVLISRKKIEGERDSVPIHEKPHGNKRIWSVFFTFSIFFASIFFFNLKIIIRTVVV